MRTFDKLNSVLMSFRNLINSVQAFEVDFSSSKNLLIRGGAVKGQKVRLELEGQQMVVLELLPNRMREGLLLENFDITKIDKRE